MNRLSPLPCMLIVFSLACESNPKSADAAKENSASSEAPTSEDAPSEPAAKKTPTAAAAENDDLEIEGPECGVYASKKGASLSEAIDAHLAEFGLERGAQGEGGVISYKEVDDPSFEAYATFSSHSEDSETTSYWVAVRHDQVWYMTDLTSVSTMDIRTLREVKFDDIEAKQLIPGGPPELFIRYTYSELDTLGAGDEGEEIEEEKTTSIAVLDMSKERPMWQLHLYESIVWEHAALGEKASKTLKKTQSRSQITFDEKQGMFTVTNLNKDKPLNEDTGTFNLSDRFSCEKHTTYHR